MENASTRLVLVVSTVLSLGLIVSAQAPPPARMPKNLADIAREIRAKRQSLRNPLISNLVSTSQAGQAETQYEREIQTLLARSGFADLDAAASKVRNSKERFAGGAWKLYAFYEATANPAAGDRATGDDWTRHLAKLQEWVTARPQSVTPRVALAEAYRSLAWNARGGSFANKVSDANWRLFEGQDLKAFQILAEAEQLPEKCPHLYFVMLEIARDQGANKEQTRTLFERAIAFEPAYYHYYREYALNLLPKWNGNPGEAEAFADESYRRIGGSQGTFVYFEIATVIYCMCYAEPVKPVLSWTTIKEGFAETERQYGATTLKLNRFALLAYLYRDREITKNTLNRMNDKWEASVWRNKDSFNSARTWAGLSAI